MDGRRSGILLPIFSLPSRYGIGSLGQEAFRFIDFLAACDQSYWQILPLGPTSLEGGNSPYSAISSFAGNPYLIDLDILVQEGLLDPLVLADLDFGNQADRVDYRKVYRAKDLALGEAFKRFQSLPYPLEFEQFVRENRSWLEDYALYRAISQELGLDSWPDWPEALRNRDRASLAQVRARNRSRLDYEYFLQYEFFKQYDEVKAYAHERGVGIIGDMSIYVPLDSSDCWSYPEAFLLDEDRRPLAVSGVPPDKYSTEGQLWGHPLYDWDGLAKEGYPYWLDRVRAANRLFDKVRLDHFIGFVRYYAINPQAETAADGHWVQGPGRPFFDRLYEEIPGLDFLAEDLGSVTEEVEALRDELGLPGMRVLLFAFEGGLADQTNKNLPHAYTPQSVAYSSTHDSDTFMGWFKEADPACRSYAQAYLDFSEGKAPNWEAIRWLLASVAGLTIFPIQDLLGLDNRARINLPGQAKGNWEWRLEKDYFQEDLVDKMARLMTIYQRKA